MKNILIVFVTFFSPLCCYSQFDSSVWLPEKYVQAELKHDTNSSKYLFPIEAFVGANKEAFVQLYKGGEPKALSLQKININGVKKIKLINLQYTVNLMYNSKDFYNQIANSIFYISKIGDRIFLEIYRNGTKNEIYFVNRINNLRFNEIEKAKQYLEQYSKTSLQF